MEAVLPVILGVQMVLCKLVAYACRVTGLFLHKAKETLRQHGTVIYRTS